MKSEKRNESRANNVAGNLLKVESSRWRWPSHPPPPPSTQLLPRGSSTINTNEQWNLWEISLFFLGVLWSFHFPSRKQIYSRLAHSILRIYRIKLPVDFCFYFHLEELLHNFLVVGYGSSFHSMDLLPLPIVKMRLSMFVCAVLSYDDFFVSTTPKNMEETENCHWACLLCSTIHTHTIYTSSSILWFMRFHWERIRIVRNCGKSRRPKPVHFIVSSVFLQSCSVFVSL